MACFLDADGVAIGTIKYGGKETIIVKEQAINSAAMGRPRRKKQCVIDRKALFKAILTRRVWCMKARIAKLG
jgi:hypothetical protein